MKLKQIEPKGYCTKKRQLLNVENKILIFFFYKIVKCGHKKREEFFPQFYIIYAVQFLGMHERPPSGEVIVVVHFKLHLDSCIHWPLQPHLNPNSQSQMVSFVGRVGHPIGTHVLLSHIVPIRKH